MTTQELKQYIDKVLGNNLRCLLPSYWWKRLFNQVADRIDDKQDILVSGKNIKTINGKNLLGEGDTNADIIINSVDELNALDLPAGSRASVVTGGPVLSSIRDCVESNDKTQWTRVSGVQINAFPDFSLLSADVNEASIYFFEGTSPSIYIIARKDESGSIMGAVRMSTSETIYLSLNGVDISQAAVDKLNGWLKTGDYKVAVYDGLHDISDFFDSFIKFYIYHPTISDVYVKADSWEMLTKENVVNSEDELDGLSVPYGSIAKVNSKQYGKINPFNCYRITSTSQPPKDTVKRNWDKLKRITKIDIINPDAEPSTMPIILLHGYANLRGDFIQISYYNGYRIGKGNGSSAVAMSLDELNSLLKNSDYRLLMISDTAEHREFFDKYVSLYSPDFIVPNAYIKGETWTRLLKEGDVTGGGLQYVEERTVYPTKFISNISITEEQRAYNIETLNKVRANLNVFLVYNGCVFAFNRVADGGAEFAIVSHTNGKLMGLSLFLLNDGSAVIENAKLFDSELSTSSENAVQNKVVTAALNSKVDKVNGKQLSTEDFTSALKTKLEGLSNYDDTSIQNAVNSLTTQINTLVSGDASAAIESFNEIIAFLNGVEDSESLDSIIAAIQQQIAGKVDKAYVDKQITNLTNEIIANEEVHAGAYNDLNTRLNELSENVQGKTITKEEFNAAIEGVNNGISAKQDVLVSGTNIKTINNASILGRGNIEINVDTSNLASKEELQNLQKEVIANEEITAAAINDLNTRLAALEAAFANL